jgi:hypothetical protein
MECFAQLAMSAMVSETVSGKEPHAWITINAHQTFAMRVKICASFKTFLQVSCVMMGCSARSTIPVMGREVVLGRRGIAPITIHALKIAVMRHQTPA